MYEDFYKFERQPFTNIPDPGLLYMSPQHQRALSILQYALMARAGFCVITGDVGAGKTTLLRSVLQNLEFEVEIGLVSNTQCDSFEEFLSWILLAFDLDQGNKSKVEMYDTFVKYLIEQHDKGRPVTLIIDEAQHLGYKYLEQLRMLSNVNTEKGQLLQTILVGQPELWDLLRRPELEQFAQRISYDYFLSPLEDTTLTEQYIKTRLEKVGCEEDIFASDTFDTIWKATGGVPRLINLLCDTALVYGYAEQKEQIDLAVIEQVIKDKERSFSPIGKKQAPAPASPNFRAPMPVNPNFSSEDMPALDDEAMKKLSTIERAALKLRK